MKGFPLSSSRILVSAISTVAVVAIGVTLVVRGHSDLAATAPSDPVSWARVSVQQVEFARAAGVPVAFQNAIGMRFVLVPPGSFLMGSREDEERRDQDELRHEVTISHAYYMSIYETRIKEFDLYSGERLRYSDQEGPDRPVVGISHDDASKFASWLTSRDSKYDYALPTEAQWEYAARARTTKPFPFFNLVGNANYNPSEAYGMDGSGHWLRRTLDVGQYHPNAWGLYDTVGNVWEWCADWYAEYPSGSLRDPTGPESGTRRVMRGGSWYNPAWEVRSATRGSNLPGTRSDGIGFRVAASLRPE